MRNESCPDREFNRFSILSITIIGRSFPFEKPIKSNQVSCIRITPRPREEDKKIVFLQEEEEEEKK